MDLLKALIISTIGLVIAMICVLILVFAFNPAPMTVMLTSAIMLFMVIPETVIIALMYMFTPAPTFLMAWLGKKKLDAHFGEDRYFRIKATTNVGGLSEIKKEGMYQSRPEDTYIEAKSKLPISIHYGKCSLSLTPKMAAVSKRLEDMGVHNFEDLMIYYRLLQEQKKSISEGKPIPKDQVLPDKINVWGESVNMAEVVKYFSSTERSDVIEAEIQRRVAAEIMNRMGLDKGILKWVLIAGIFIICAAIAYVIISQAMGGGGGGTTIINNFLQNATDTITGKPSIITNASLNVSGPANPAGVIVT